VRYYPKIGSSGGGGGTITGGSNLGAGEGVFAQVNGANLEFKSLVGSSGITITPSSTELTFSIDTTALDSIYARLDCSNQPFTGVLNLSAYNSDKILCLDSLKNVSEVSIGTGLIFSGGVLANTDPDQVVSITGDSDISVGGSYPNFSLSFINGSGFITSAALAGYALLDSSNQPFVAGGFNSLNTSLRIAYDTAGVDSIAWDNRRFFNEFGSPIMDFNSGQSWIGDTAGVPAIYYVARTLNDSGAAVTVDWQSGQLFFSGQLRLDWQLFLLNDTYGVNSASWDSRLLLDSSALQSLDWNTRNLISSGGFSKFDWEGLKFPTLTTNGFLVTSGGDGTISVDTSTFISSLNGLTDATQTFATATTGTDFTITSSAGVHTFAIPDASTTARGLVTTGTQSFEGLKSFIQLSYWPISAATANTVYYGINLINTTTASSGNQMYSKAILFTGNGWKTNVVAGSQQVDFRNYLVPVQGTANPSCTLYWDSSINTGAYTNRMVLTSGGNLGIANTTPFAPITVTGITSTLSRLGFSYSNTYGQSYISCEFSSGSQNGNVMYFHVNQIGGTGTQVLQIIGNGSATFLNSINVTTSTGTIRTGSAGYFLAGDNTSTTVPSFIVAGGDTNTGFGRGGADVANVIAGGVEGQRWNGAGDSGIGNTGTISARLHIIKTTEQLRVGYDASNYYSTTVSSAGAVTFDAVGASAGFTFNDKIINTVPQALKGYTVATLPAGVTGDICYVTDALAPAYLGILVGGGAVVTLAFYDGTNWTAH